MGRWLDQPDHNLEALVAPISQERPCGEWLRYQGTYEQVREARREDDANLPQGVWQSELKRAGWDTVEALCGDALLHATKDLQLAAWLLEAWIQLDGFAGARRGIELMQCLCETYWDHLYPALSEDLEARLAPIQWVNEKLSRRLRLVPLTHPAMESVHFYSLADWEVALRNPGDSGGSKAVTMAKFQQSVALTPHEWFLEANDNVLAAIARVRAFDGLVDERAAKQAPGLLKFRGELASAAQLLETMLEATRPQVPLADVAMVNAAVDPSLAPPGPVQLLESGEAAVALAYPGRIGSRAEAYLLLEEIATFLQRVDPHSPTPYLIRRAVTWGEMNFNELLPELVRDNGELSDIVKLLRLDLLTKR